VLDWLRRFGHPRPFSPTLLPALLVQAKETRPSLQRWIASPLYGPTSAVTTGDASVVAGLGELIGLDLLVWVPETGSRYVLELRGLNERWTWEICVYLGGRRVVATDKFPALQTDIRGMESLAQLLEGLDRMHMCSGVPRRALQSSLFSSFQYVLSPKSSIAILKYAEFELVELTREFTNVVVRPWCEVPRSAVRWPTRLVRTSVVAEPRLRRVSLKGANHHYTQVNISHTRKIHTEIPHNTQISHNSHTHISI